jgi:dTDP-4-dehydrorhamnose reductase
VKVLITGASGQVGRALQLTVPCGIELKAPTREQLDIRDASAVLGQVEQFGPDLIINAAAYTAVDRAESEPEVAMAINGVAPGRLAEAAKRLSGCRLLHISTDYVFDGLSDRSYRPSDTPTPLSVYGRTKLEGEKAVLASLGQRATVLRTAWVYAAQGRNFLLTMLRLLRERAVVRVVADQRGSPTAALSIAQALWRVAERPQVNGVLHWTDAGNISWYEFARAIAEDAARIGLVPASVLVTPISTAEYPTAARRPANSALDLAASIAQLDLTPWPWRERVRSTLQQISEDG